MDGNGSSRKERQALRRIVALLFSLAALAECAGAKPRPIRVAVLWLLRVAEWVAWDFVAALAWESGVDGGLAEPIHGHDIADEAARLAQSFTVLAELLAELIRLDPPPLPLGRIGDLIERLMQSLGKLADAQGMLERSLPDTS